MFLIKKITIYKDHFDIIGILCDLLVEKQRSHC